MLTRSRYRVERGSGLSWRAPGGATGRARRGCAEEWAVYDAVPREGANVLVDVFPATEANAGLYEGEEVAEQVMDAAYELHDLVSACVALRDPDGRP